MITGKLNKSIAAGMAAALSVLTFASCGGTSSVNDGDFNIVTSFYPMYILTMNVVGDIEGVSLNSMAQPNIGCIHDYVFSTDALRMIEGADVYVENGLGLESFNDQILEAYPDITIVEAASGVTDAAGEEDGGYNGHVWTNLNDYILEVETVRDELSSIDPDNADRYRENADDYIGRLQAVQTEYADVIASLQGRKVLVLDEALPSFCIYTGIDYMAVETDHDQEALSAGVIRETIEYMNANDIDTIFIGTESESAGIAQTISSETGATVYTLNTMMTGEVDPDAYIDQLTENFVILSEMT